MRQTSKDPLQANTEAVSNSLRTNVLMQGRSSMAGAPHFVSEMWAFQRPGKQSPARPPTSKIPIRCNHAQNHIIICKSKPNQTSRFHQPAPNPSHSQQIVPHGTIAVRRPSTIDRRLAHPSLSRNDYNRGFPILAPGFAARAGLTDVHLA